MPGWHAATKELLASKKLNVIGIVQEQHPDRARLFMKWKGMNWPILVDSLNRLGVSAVPISLLIDEHGIIRAKVRNPRRSAKVLETFLVTNYAPPDRIEKEARKTKDTTLALADAMYLKGEAFYESAIATYRRAIQEGSGPDAKFRLGVAHRARYDSKDRRSGDFAAAVKAWGEALAARPNQYIWRRRIQQYGPRLEKPYAFYDWVEAAKRDLRKRGETPPPLRVEPRGAEIARPSRSFATDTSGKNPDAKGQITRDKTGFIRGESVVVPHRVRPGKTARAHLVLSPSKKQKAHWNNEAKDLLVWIDPPPGIAIDKQLLTVPNPKRATSTEDRSVEFEVKVGRDTPKGRIEVPAYALYYVCEDVDGVCMFLRQDFKIYIDVDGT